MKKIVIFALLLFVFKTNHAQDSIYLKSGQIVSSQIIRIGINTIEYQLFNYSDGPIFKKYLNEIYLIKYQNKTIDFFNKDSIFNQNAQIVQATNIPINDIDINILSSSELEILGRRDAQENYDTRYLGASVFFTSFILGPIGGLVSAAIIKGKTPSEGNLNMPITPTLASPIYQTAYKQEASNIKKRNVNTSSAFGVTLSLLIWSIYGFSR